MSEVESSDVALRTRAVQAVRRHRPHLGDAELRALGGGLDHRTYLVDDLVVRVAEHPGAGREAELLALVAAHVSLPVPAPCFSEPGSGVLAYPYLPGRPLLGRTPPPPAAEILGLALRELHGIPRADVDDRAPVDAGEPAAWLDGLDGPSSLLRVLDREVPRPTDALVLAHADLGPSTSSSGTAASPGSSTGATPR